jgi:hypothetical protein
MKYENFNIGVSQLYAGVEKLLKYGMSTFKSYADEINMSFCDRNRVISKCIVAHGKKELNEMVCPKNLIGERWNFFTKTMGYSNEKAREVSARLDSSFKSRGKYDITKLAQGIG